MKSFAICLLGLLGLVSVGSAAEPMVLGQVRQSNGLPVVAAEVLLFDLADLRRGVVARATTDASGHFALRLASWGGRARPSGFALGPNYPNPFNPSTVIPYHLPASGFVRLEVFNLLGQRIATLVDGARSAGSHAAVWDATDASGRSVGAGVYVYRLTAGAATATGRMVLVDGQAGVAAAGPSAVELAADSPVYGLAVSGAGLVAYVDAGFRVGEDAVDIVLAAPGGMPLMKVSTDGGVLGDVDNNGRVNFFDMLLVALYSYNVSPVLPNNGHILLGDVNADGRVDLADAYVLATYLNNPSDSSLPSGIGQAVRPSGDDHGDTRSDATLLSVGSSVAGQIETGGDVDYFQVQISGSGELAVYTTGSLDTYGRLESSSDSSLATNDDGGRGNNFRIDHSVDSGTYYLQVRGFSSSTGSYTVHASFSGGGDGLPGDGGDGLPGDGGDGLPGDDHGDTRSDATLLSVGSSVAGQIETGGDVDYFRVQISESGELAVYTTGSLDTYGRLESSSGSSLATDDDGGRGNNFRIDHSVDSGTYYLQVRGYSSSGTGSYTVHASFSGGGDGLPGDGGDGLPGDGGDGLPGDGGDGLPGDGGDGLPGDGGDGLPGDGGDGLPGASQTFSLPGGVSMDFVWIAPGVFQMGSPSSEPDRFVDEGPVHEVEISQGFYLGTYEVTQGQWEAVMGETPWSGRPYVREDSSHPAVWISWDDVHAFIGRLNDAAGDSLYRLPSEAEWEYACRAGTSTRWSFGDDESQLTHYAWYGDNTIGGSHGVGLKRPNPWGLYDMHGNVYEWVQDWYDEDYYNSSPRVDPPGPPGPSLRVLRGGTFGHSAWGVRSALRYYSSTDYAENHVSVRLLRIR